jgi:phosphoenolpyruvate carboxylase
VAVGSIEQESPEASVQERLSADVHMLAEMLGGIIQRLAGPEAFALIEELRGSCRSLRTQPSVGQARELRSRLEQLDLPALRILIRAFSVYFDLINLAEQQARVRAIRQRTAHLSPQPLTESPEVALVEMRERGVAAHKVAQLLPRAFVSPVFTAHPSEARRRTVLEKLESIAEQLDRLEYHRLLPREQQAAGAAIAEEVEAFWLTETVRSKRPTVLDEVRQGLQVVGASLFEVVPRFYRELEAALGRVYPDQAWDVPSLLRFGSWIGGDRDGNPHVTSSVTIEAVRLQQEAVLRHYLRLADQLGRRLSHSETSVPASVALRASLERDAALFDDVTVDPREPLRGKCRFLAARLRRTLAYVRSHRPIWSLERFAAPPGVLMDRRELAADLALLGDELRNAGAAATADGFLQDFRRVVDVFGLHLLTLDLRQHSARHGQALEEIFEKAGVCSRYLKLSANDRFDVLVQEIQQQRPLIPTHLPYSAETCEIVETFRATAALLEQQCPEAIQNYVISGAAEPAHLLEVLLLAREARLFRPAENVSRINIVPLFESLEPLKSAVSIVQRLLTLPIYRKHVQLRGDFQEIMIGYSDSNKETGFLQSAWALYRVQRELSETGRRTGVVVQFFHGRGGAVGRGGGPANHAILAQPRRSVEGRLRITEQGEVIADRYGHHAVAERHLEQVLNAVLRSTFSAEEERPDPGWEWLLDRLSASACRHYRALVYETPEFLPYFEQATPIAEISQLKIASRPARRGATVAGIEQLRAIPWVFSWMQSRHTLPGWYGLGAAVAEHLGESEANLATLRTMYERWPFWRTLIDNAQMILAKADLTIARLYADLVEDRVLGTRIFERIGDEYQRTVDVICQITGQRELLENAPVLQRSIQRRNPYVDALSFVQLVLLKRLRGGAPVSDELMTAVLESINGIAAGLKNTG